MASCTVPEDSSENMKSQTAENPVPAGTLRRMPQQTDRPPQDIHNDTESHNSINV